VSASASGAAATATTRIDQHLVVDQSGMIVCERCGHELGPATENYKLHAVRKDRPIQDANPRIVDPAMFIDREVVFRQYFCPGCAVALDNEVILAESPPVWDKQIS
jgi:N-methylhydantoinase B